MKLVCDAGAGKSRWERQPRSPWIAQPGHAITVVLRFVAFGYPKSIGAVYLGYHSVDFRLREFETTRARSNGRSMVLPAGGGALVCAAGRCGVAGAQHGLLRGWLLPHRCPSSPQTAACAAATIVSGELRARHEWLGRGADAVLHVLLPGPSPSRTYSGVFPAPRDNFYSVC